VELQAALQLQQEHLQASLLAYKELLGFVRSQIWVSFQLNSAVQETPSDLTPNQNVPTTPQVNANQAEGVPVPQEVVTLTNRIPEEQETRGDHPFTAFERLALLVDDTGVSIGSNGEATDGYSPQVPGAAVSNQTGFAAMLQQDPSTADVALAANTAADQETAVSTQPNAASSMTPQQKLAQLDQMLQEIGIDPQKISLFNRIAMLQWANNPVALKNFAQSLRTAAQKPVLLDSTRAESGQAQGSAEALQSSQGQSQTQTQIQDSSGGVGIKVIATQFSLADSAGTFPTPSAGRTSQPVTINTAISNSAGSALDVTA
jgi:hypothetical protein